MIDAILTHIKDNILTNNPNTFQKGFSGARQYQDGKVVIYDNFEGTYVGLQDTLYNYFYIRYVEEIDLDAASDARTSSCFELTGIAPLRLVAWVYHADFGKLSEVLLNDIMNTDFTTLTQANKQRFSDIKIQFSGLITDPEVLYKEETLKEDEEVKLTKNAVLLGIDFGIQFNYKTKKGELTACLDRTICSDVCS